MKTIKVAAGALVNAQGQVLINERPVGKPMAGYWEFPGGKLELGETPEQALVRELKEELDITAVQIEPLLQLQHDYPDKRVQLYVFSVLSWQGEVRSQEQQALAWVQPAALTTYKLLPADGPIVTALQLPKTYFITSDCVDWDALQIQLREAAGHGFSLLQVRQKTWSAEQLQACMAPLESLAEELGVTIQMNGHTHWTAAQLMAAESRPSRSGWLSASCHTVAELAQAEALGLDFVVLGPVQVTASHPGQLGLGWSRFAEYVATTHLPVYALGGLSLQDLPQALAHGAQGVAAITGFERDEETE